MCSFRGEKRWGYSGCHEKPSVYLWKKIKDYNSNNSRKTLLLLEFSTFFQRLLFCMKITRKLEIKFLFHTNRGDLSHGSCAYKESVCFGIVPLHYVILYKISVQVTVKKSVLMIGILMCCFKRILLMFWPSLARPVRVHQSESSLCLI